MRKPRRATPNGGRGVEHRTASMLADCVQGDAGEMKGGGLLNLKKYLRETGVSKQ
jgi:hypothetical protein